MAFGFQSSAFQDNAFQNSGVAPPVVVTPDVPFLGGAGWRKRALSELPWKKKKRLKKADQIEEVAEVVEQVIADAAPTPELILNLPPPDVVARQLLEMQSLDTLRRIRSGEDMLIRIKDALDEIDDEEVLMFLN